VRDLQKKIQKRIYLLAIMLVLPFIAIVYKLVILQWVEGPELKAKVEEQIIKYHTIPPIRGNIYSADRKLLATSVPTFDVYFDPIAVSRDIWSNELDALAAKLAQFSKTKGEWTRILSAGRQSGNRYIKLLENLTFSELQQIKQFPIFRHGKFKGGLIVEQKAHRRMPMGTIAERTIGYSSANRGQTGLEGACDIWLKGKEGKRWMQRMAKGHWKPINNGWDEDPVNGYDVVSTLDSRIQDILHHELLQTLINFEADHGTAVVMEVKTGKIKAMVNLGRTEGGYYAERLNYAIWESSEPGSTFKLLTAMILLEDKKADTNTLIDIGNGSWVFYDRIVTESNFSEKGSLESSGQITLAKAFEQSSNVAFARLVFEHYKDQPSAFVDKLYKMGLHKSVNFEIKGETAPMIPHPEDKTQWSGITLPWMAFGYQTSFTPLQLLTVYNAIANDGVMVRPYIVEEIRNSKRVIKRFGTTVLNSSVCSRQTLEKLKVLLANVVRQGTAKHLYNPAVPLAGKTGTAKLDYWKEKNSRKYRASFAGYFPADQPQYSIIVVVDRPNPDKAYYGSKVAAPVAARSASAIMGLTPASMPVDSRPAERILALSKSKKDPHELEDQVRKQVMPNLVGLTMAQAVALMENKGFKVSSTGSGPVNWQYPPQGSQLSRSVLIELKSFNP
jgi:cell division protein FtsI (penicillin-binding protein 3)